MRSTSHLSGYLLSLFLAVFVFGCGEEGAELGGVTYSPAVGADEVTSIGVESLPPITVTGDGALSAYESDEERAANKADRFDLRGNKPHPSP